MKIDWYILSTSIYAVTSAFLCFLPSIIISESGDDFAEYNIGEIQIVKFMFIGSISVSTVLLFQHLIYLYFLPRITYFSFLTCLVLTVYIFSDLFLFVSMSTHPNTDFTQLVLCARSMFLSHLVMSQIYSTGIISFGKYFTGFISSCVTVTTTLIALSYFTLKGPLLYSLNFGTLLCVLISSLCIFYYCGRYVFIQYVSQDNVMDLKFMKSSGCILLFLYFTMGLWITWIIDISENRQHSPYILRYAYGEIILIISFILLEGLLERVRSVTSKDGITLNRHFIRYISHEICTPLNVVHLGLKLLQKELLETDLSSPHLRTVEEIMVSCDATLTILNDLLIYEGIESGNLQMKCKNVDIVPFIKESIQVFSIQLRSKEVEVTLAMSAETIQSLYKYQIYIDKRRMTVVIRNLLSNAIKFNRKGGHVIIRASIATSRNGLNTNNNNNNNNYNYDLDLSSLHVLRLEVMDDGIGISKENLQRIFKQAVQFDGLDGDESQGAGLGLLIAKEIVSSHGGKLTVSSSGYGRGSTFSVLLPAFEATRTGSGGVSLVHQFYPGRDSGDYVDSSDDSDRSEADGMAPLSQEDLAVQAEEGIGKPMFIRRQSAQSPGQGQGFQNSVVPDVIESSYSESDTSSERNLERSGTMLHVDSFRYSQRSSRNDDLTASVDQVDSSITTRGSKDDEIRQGNSVTERGMNPSPHYYINTGASPSTKIHRKSMNDLSGLARVIPMQDEEVFLRSSSSSSSYQNMTRAEHFLSQRHLSSSEKQEFLIETVIEELPNPEDEKVEKITPRAKHTDKPKLRILLVDDAHVSRKMVRRLLLSLRMTTEDLCDEVEDGFEAIAKIKQCLEDPQPYDAVLMDYMMPNMDGPTAAKEIRAMGYEGKIIGITGNMSPVDINKFLSQGADKVLAKPLDIVALESALSNKDTRGRRASSRPSFPRLTPLFSSKVGIDETALSSPSSRQSFSEAMMNFAATTFRRASFSRTAPDLPSEKAESTTTTPTIVDELPMLNTILLVDDFDKNRNVMDKLFGTRKIKCEHANDGLQAVHRIRQASEQNSSIDVVLMEYMMPNMDGPTAAKEMRAMGYKGKILGVIDNKTPDEFIIFMTSGADRVLAKPLDIKVLLAALSENFQVPEPKKSSFSSLMLFKDWNPGSPVPAGNTNRKSSKQRTSHVVLRRASISNRPSKIPQAVRNTSKGDRVAWGSKKQKVSEDYLFIMVVSADDVIRRARAVYFRSKYHYCDEAINGMEAISKVRRSFEQKKPFDAIVMDFRMPNMDGPSAAFEIRKMGYKGKIVGVLGSESNEWSQVFAAHGADLVICEPIDFHSLGDYFHENCLEENRYVPPEDYYMDWTIPNNSSLSPKPELHYRSSSPRRFPPTIKVNRSRDFDNEQDRLHNRKSFFPQIPSQDFPSIVASLNRSFSNDHTGRSSSRSPRRMSSSRSPRSPKWADQTPVLNETHDEDSADADDVKIQRMDAASDYNPSGRSTRYTNRSRLQQDQMIERMDARSDYSPSSRMSAFSVLGRFSESPFSFFNMGTPVTNKKYIILIVDEIVMKRKMIIKILSSRTKVCVEAKDGLQALDKVGLSLEQGISFDVIIVSDMAENMDGPTCVKAIRAMGFVGKIIGLVEQSPVKALTESRFLSQGADIVFNFPIQVNDFDECLRGSGTSGAPSRPPIRLHSGQMTA